MFKLSKKTQLLGLSALCVALIVFIVYLILGGGDKTPVAVDSGIPGDAVSGAPAPPTAPTTPANPASTAERVSGPFYYAESAAYSGLPDWDESWRHAIIDNNNQLIVINREQDAGIRPGSRGAYEYLYITDCENAERYGPLPAGYIVYGEGGAYTEAESIQGFTFDENNNMYMLYADENYKTFLNVYDGQFNEIKAGIPWDSDREDVFWYRDMAYYNGNIYTYGSGETPPPKIEFFSPDAVKLGEMDEYPWVWCMEITGDGYLYTLNDNARRDETFLSKFDLNTWEPVYNRKIARSTSDIMGHVDYICFNPKDGCVYLAGSKAIMRYDEENYTYETMIEYGADTRFFVGATEAGELEVQDFECDRDGRLYLLGKTMDEGGVIYTFSMTPGQKPVRGETGAAMALTLTACVRDRFLTEAVKRYELLNPDIKIEYDVMYESEDEFAADYNDAVARMLTRVLSNDIGDMVVITDIVQQALATDVFIDLWDRVRSDASYPDLNLHAFNGLRAGGIRPDGKLTGLPVGLTYKYLLYNRALGGELGLAPDFGAFTWGDAVNLALELDFKARGVYLYGGRWEMDNMLDEVIRRNLPDLMDREKKVVNLKQDWFITLLEKLKTVEALGVTKITAFDDAAFSDCLFVSGGYTYNNYYEAMNQAFNYGDEYLMIPMPSGELNRNATAYQTYMCSISARSQHQDEAWGFLSYLIDNKTQAFQAFNAIPVNNKTINAQTELMVGGSENEWARPYMPAVERLRVIFDRIDVLGESKYNGYLFSSLTDYIYGNGPLNAALDKAEYDIWLMLNE